MAASTSTSSIHLSPLTPIHSSSTEGSTDSQPGPIVKWGSAWIELDSNNLIERTLQILSSRFSRQFFPAPPEARPDLNLFFASLDFLSALQKLLENESLTMDVAQFKTGLTILTGLLAAFPSDLDEHPPEFLEYPELFLQVLEQSGKTFLCKKDLFLIKEPISSEGIESIYGSESILSVRVWKRLLQFGASMNMVMTTQIVGADKCRGALERYTRDTYSAILALNREGIVQINPDLLAFYQKKGQEINQSCRPWHEICKQMHAKTLQKYVNPLGTFTKSTKPFSKGILREQLTQGEQITKAFHRLYGWNETHFHKLQTKWQEASALLLFVIYSVKAPYCKGSLEQQFIQFKQDFTEKEGSLRQNLFPLLISTHRPLYQTYLDSEKKRQGGLTVLNDQIEQFDMFFRLIQFMEETLHVYHKAHRSFLDGREKSAAEHQLTGTLRRNLSHRSPSVETSSMPSPIEEARSSSSSEPSSHRIEDSLHQAVAETTNPHARNALYNAISLLEDLLNELHATTIRSVQERIEHLDLLLVNLSLIVEQMLSFKVLQGVNPKSRLDARQYLTHNLPLLCQRLPEDLRAEAMLLAEALNGVENCSRFIDPTTSPSEAIKLLMQVHNEDCNLELQKTVYLFIKTQLENALRILFNKNIVTDEWQAKWQRFELSIASSIISLREYSEEMFRLLARIDAAVVKCKSRSNTVWTRNAERLFTQLKTRVMMAKDAADLNVTEKRTAGLICLASWSLCIASAAAKQQVDLQRTHISELSKNLWDWIELLLGEAKTDALPPGEQYFCDLSARIHYQNRYQYSAEKHHSQTLWRIGFDPQEEAATSFHTVGAKAESQHLVTLHDGLAFAERILNTLPIPSHRGKRR